jgi:hypothetical protein
VKPYPRANQPSETAASLQVYLDGTLRFAAIALPRAAATRLARSALRAAADAMLVGLALFTLFSPELGLCQNTSLMTAGIVHVRNLQPKHQLITPWRE